jgi:superfamily I DNA/RNA helicase
MPPDVVLPTKPLFSYLSSEEIEFLRAPWSGAALTHFSSDDEILQVVEASPSDTSTVLLDVLIHLRDYRIDSAKGVLDLAIGRAQPLAEFQGDIAEEIKKSVNRENLINLRDLSEAEYNQVLTGSLSDWMLYLHPDQQAVAFDDYDGAVRLQGVAGSGKTSVLLHRAKHLAEKYKNENIAIFTLNPSLAALLVDLLSDLASPDVCARIHVYDLESFAKVVIGRFLPTRLLQAYDPRSTETLEDCFWDSYEKPEQIRTLRDVFSYLRNRKVNIERYLRDEFVWVRSAFRSRTDESKFTSIPSRNTYLDATAAPREGRSVPFISEYRSAILSALQFYEEHMDAGGFADQAAVVLLAHSCLDRLKASNSPFKYRSILVDEVQDLSSVEIELVSACMLSSENGLFLVGDPEQQVYPKEHNLRKAGVEIDTRRFFRKNYRNPRQILEAAFELLRLHGQQGVDPEDDKLVIPPEYATRQSSKPLLVKCVDEDDQISFLANFGNRRLAESDSAMCLILCSAREDDETKISDFAAKLRHCKMPTEQLFGTKKVQPKTVYLSGLETVKGFEFSRVFIVGIGDQFPAPDLPKEEAWRDVRRLYVALTRARDEVVLTYTDKKSPCLVGLEEFLSETTSAEQIDTVVSVSDSDQVSFCVSAATTPISVSSSNSVVPTHTPSLPVIHQSDSGSLVESLRTSKLEVFDKRDRGGCLWVVGGFELQTLMDKFKSDGFKFSFTPNGSRTTRHRPAWYLK